MILLQFVLDVFLKIVAKIPVCMHMVCTAVGTDLDEPPPRRHNHSSSTTFAPKIVGDLEGVSNDEFVFKSVVVVCTTQVVCPSGS